MGHPARDIFSAALLLPEADRLELASTLIASVDGPADPDWQEAWMDEIEEREAQKSQPSAAWPDVRGRVLERLSRA